ncbi:Lrp/AsnC family transcriptional regulator [Nocardioides campestrisoli]|uniref:Lrp/AsnC family transcriptional regulator n=1 Tax=Nocardioides campestrisoli TaxID=2736757 RepID=UPI0015E7DE8C|nr:Lrp/AsnC family transcriptional regulator [Nocardioides campestrisoli]
MDALDRRLLDLFSEDPRIGVLEASRRLAVARGTVQARLDRLARTGVITDWAPRLSPAALGYPVTAFLTLEIRQGSGHQAVATHLAAIAEVLEVHTITGAGDLWARVVARSNADLQRVIDLVLDDAAIVRCATVISLTEQVGHRVLPLARAAAAPQEPPEPPA